MRYGEREYAYAAPIAAALANDAKFREWILLGTKFADRAALSRVLAEEIKARRSSRAGDWWRSHYSQKCPCEGCRGHETDLLAIIELSDETRVALHFEVKQPTDVFHKGQGRAYSLRASCWISNPPRAIVPHKEATTLLLCSAGNLTAYASEAGEFDKIITFEELASSFPGLIPAAVASDKASDPHS